VSEAPSYPEGHRLLDGKTVLITAAAGTGIGFATAKRCAKEGARVAISDLHERRLGEAAEICLKEMDAEAKRLKKLQERMLKGLHAKLPEIYVNGDLEQRIPGNLNISFAHVEGESLMMGIKGLSVSSGSACTSASLEPSYVLRALGVEEEMAHTSLRIGLGRFTTEQEVDTAVADLVHHVTKLREMSPLWEMSQEGIDIKSIEWAAH